MGNQKFFGVVTALFIVMSLNTVQTKSYSKMDPIVRGTTFDKLPDERSLHYDTILNVAPFPYIPDPYHGNNAHLLQFIHDEFRKLHPNIYLIFRPMNTGEDFYNLEFLQSLLAMNDTGYDVVEIDTVVLGDLVDLGLVTPQVNYARSTPETSDWHPAAYSAVQVNQATYAFPHLMCAFYLFTHGDIQNRVPIRSLAELEKYVNSTTLINGVPNLSMPHRLVGNLNSSWDMTALWLDSHRDQTVSLARAEAEALHGYEHLSFRPMRKFARLCDTRAGKNPCLDKTFDDDYDLPALLFANYQSAAMFGYSERLFHILNTGPASNYVDLKIQALPLGENYFQPTFFTDAYVFRRNLSAKKLAAAEAFVKFMATPRMQAAVVANEAFSSTVSFRYLLPMAKSTYNQPLLRYDRFYDMYFHDPSFAGGSYPNTGFLKTRYQLVDAIKKFIDQS